MCGGVTDQPNTNFSLSVGASGRVVLVSVARTHANRDQFHSLVSRTLRLVIIGRAHARKVKTAVRGRARGN